MTQLVGALPPRWRLRDPYAHQNVIPRFPPVVAAVLAARGITTRQQADAFYKPHLLPAHDPLLLPGMADAVRRVARAIEDGELIALYGDFDVDGVTSIAILREGLGPLGARTLPYIPDRFTEGYGLNFGAIRSLAAAGATLLVTADCGISSVAEVAYANELGLDVIILDHHTVPEVLPDALAAVNPKRIDSPYPFDELAACGVAYRFLEVLYDYLGRPFDDADFIDLAALGTVADVAPLVDENRRIVARGLEVMRSGGLRPGLAALSRVAGVTPERFTSETLGFALGPRMNAAGRLAHANIALQLLLERDFRRAIDLANQLHALNRERQRQTEEATQLAEELLGPADVPLLWVVTDQIAPGIVGLVASRLAERRNRPAVVLSRGPEESRASARSIPGFDIVAAIRAEKHLLVRHGGHRAAAGFTVRNEHLDELRERLTATAAARLGWEPPRRVIDIDAEAPLSALDGLEVKGLIRFEPTGHGNRKPVLLSRGVRLLQAKPVGATGDHLRLTVRHGPVTWRGIAFRQAGAELDAEVDLVYSLQPDVTGQGVELDVLDIAPSALARPLERGG
ncbi:MAG: single-stranded-DNA-specific exonuclease RecJ [Tepidiforma sp.]